MAVGNILGSNIFNTFAVMGISGLFATLSLTSFLQTIALPLMVIASLLYFFITQDKEITKWEGMLLLLFYAFFVYQLIIFVI